MSSKSASTLTFVAMALVSHLGLAESGAERIVRAECGLDQNGYKLVFLGDAASGDIEKAILSKTNILGSTVISELTVCNRHPSGDGADRQTVTKCNDVNWEGYDAFLYEGGLTGVPYATIGKNIAPEDVTYLKCSKSR